MPGPLAPWSVAFYTEGLPFDGRTVHETGLGGSESAVYFLARELAALGHRVEVFCRTRRPGRYEGVLYRQLQDFPYAAAAQTFDVFISSRVPQVFYLPFRCRLAVMWNHDNLLAAEEYRQATLRADVIFVLSAYHEAEYLSELPELAPRLHRTKNGVDPALTETARRNAVKNWCKLIYASRPERGLDILLEQIWPRLLAVRPDLELYLCGYQAPEMPGNEHIPRLVAQAARVTRLGSLAKPDFYRHLAEAALVLYPCSFPEISCIIALEAQAVGTPIITTRDFALPETVGVPDYLIPGRPALPDYQQAYIARVLDYLDDRERYQRDTDQGRGWVQGRHAWADIARQWQEVFARHLAGGRTANGYTYSVVRVLAGAQGREVAAPLVLEPPPLEVKDLVRGNQPLDVIGCRESLEQETRGEWILVLDQAGAPLNLPPLTPFLASREVEWFGFRRLSDPAGQVAAVLFRRGRPLTHGNAVMVRLS